MGPRGFLKIQDSQGFIYRKDKTIFVKSENVTKTCWECVHRSKYKCKARVSTVEDKIVHKNAEHNDLCLQLKSYN